MHRLSLALLVILALTALACSTEPTATTTPRPTAMPTPVPTPTWVLSDEYSVVIDEWASNINHRTYLNLAYDADWQRAFTYRKATSDEFNDAYLDMMELYTWTVVLPYLQPIADENGFGHVWRTMTTERTAEAAQDVERSIYLDGGRFIPSHIADNASRVADSVSNAVRRTVNSGVDYSAANRFADALIEGCLLAVAAADSWAAAKREALFNAWDFLQAPDMLMRMAAVGK